MVILSSLMFVLGIALLVLSATLLADCRTQSRRLIVHCRTGLDNAVTLTLGHYEQSSVFGSLVPVVLFLILPGAALLNALLGGSPFLFLCYLAIAVSVFVQIVIEESPHADLLRTVLSGAVVLSVLVLLPFYVVWSFTLHMLNGTPAQGALVSLIIAVILYAAIAGLWTLFAGRSQGVSADNPLPRFVAVTLFAVPLCFVIFWFALMALSSLGLDSVPFQSWTSLLILVPSGAIAFSVYMTVMDVSLGKSGPGQWGGIFISGGLGVLAISLGLALN